MQYVPYWLDERETFYGLCGRWKNALPLAHSNFAKLVFNRRHASRNARPLLGGSHFEAVHRGLLGTALSLIMERSALAVHMRFLSCDERAAAVHAVAGDGGVRSAQLRGLAAHASVNELRWCPECSDQYEERFGTATWLVEHQQPAHIMCTAHFRPLSSATVGQQRYLLPGAAELRSTDFSCADRLIPALMRLSACSQAAMTETHVSSGALARAIRRLLVAAGIVGPGHALDSARLERWFRSSDTFVALERGQFPSQVLLRRKGLVHDLLTLRRRGLPIEWLTLWCAALSEGAFNVERPSLRIEILETLPGEQICMFGAEDSFNLIPEFVQDAFEKSSSIQEVQAKLQLPKSAIKKWIKRFPELGAAIKGQFLAEHRREAVAAFDNYLRMTARPSRAGALKFAHSHVAWLQKADPQLLRRLLDSIPSSRVSQRPLWPE